MLNLFIFLCDSLSDVDKACGSLGGVLVEHLTLTMFNSVEVYIAA